MNMLNPIHYKYYKHYMHYQAYKFTGKNIFFSCRKLKSSLKCTIAFCLGNSFWQLDFTESIAFVWGGHTMHTNQDGTLHIYILMYLLYIYIHTQVRCKLPRNLPITDPAHPLTLSNPCVELALNIRSQNHTPQNHKPQKEKHKNTTKSWKPKIKIAAYGQWCQCVRTSSGDKYIIWSGSVVWRWANVGFGTVEKT
jgi:hypothetical protein